jgi:hypothetical protein
MSKRFSLVVAIVLAAATLDTGALNAQRPIGSPIGLTLRSALDAEIETTFTTPQGQFSTPGHFYRSRDGKMREDSPLGSMITDVRAGTVTVLNHARKEAKVIVVTALPRPAAPRAGTAAAPRSLGEATVEGHPVTKARTTAGGATQELWTAKDLGLVVFSKVEAPDFGMTKVLRNLSLREPDAALFRIPSDYTVTHETAPPLPPAGVSAFPSQMRPAPRQ